jgi:hypothetical protein
MSQNDPYAKLGGGALDQELFKKQQIPLSSTDDADKTITSPTPESPSPGRKQNNKKVNHSATNDVMTSPLHDVNLRAWRDTIENTETHNSSLRLTTDEGEHIEDLITDLKRKFKIKTSLNEIARLGLLHIVQDFKKNGENSLIYKVKKS